MLCRSLYPWSTFVQLKYRSTWVCRLRLRSLCLSPHIELADNIDTHYLELLTIPAIRSKWKRFDKVLEVTCPLLTCGDLSPRNIKDISPRSQRISEKSTKVVSNLIEHPDLWILQTSDGSILDTRGTERKTKAWRNPKRFLCNIVDLPHDWKSHFSSI